MSEVTWRPIPGFECYSASSDGQIRNKSGRVLKVRKDEGGYLQVKLSLDKKQINKLVHHLIAAAFLSNEEGHPEINHINRVRNDNRVENLEWISKAGNRSHRVLRPTEDLKGNRTTVWKCDVNTGEKLEMFRSLTDAAKAVNAKTSSGICDVIKQCSRSGRSVRKSAHGFKWILETHQEIQNEIWKLLSPDLVKGETGHFISSEGRFKNKAGNIREGYNHTSGYKRICIGKNDYCVHRLVAQTFLPNFFGYAVVNHKNGNKKDPRLYNLEWVSPGQNVRHAHDTGLIANKKPVRQYTLDGTFVADFRSVTDAFEATGCTGIWASATKSTISGQWRWQFIEEGQQKELPKFNGRVRPIRQLSLEGSPIADFKNMSQAAKVVGVHRALFRQRVLKCAGVCEGYKWEFLT